MINRKVNIHTHTHIYCYIHLYNNTHEEGLGDRNSANNQNKELSVLSTARTFQMRNNSNWRHQINQTLERYNDRRISNEQCSVKPYLSTWQWGWIFWEIISRMKNFEFYSNQLENHWKVLYWESQWLDFHFSLSL